jgi:limonene-1,2-epoxide hydrolase
VTDRPKNPIDVVHAFMAAMTVKDYDAALTYLAEGCEYDNIPLVKVYGPAAVRAVLEPAFAPILENDFQILHEAATGPVVFMERLDRHRFAHGWVQLPVTGVWEVHNGLITLWRDYFDRATMEKAFAPPA